MIPPRLFIPPAPLRRPETAFGGRPPLHHCRGVALVLVLAFLVLITTLVIAFFSSVSTELSGAKSFAGEATVKQLADSSVQTVMAAIRQATSGGTTVAWASQPGMIRTYSNGSGTPAANAQLAVACYKLYSSDNMVVTKDQLPFDPASDIDGQWDKKSALFTDLNSPVTNSKGNLIFPIADPRTLKSGSSTVEGFRYSDTLQGNSGTVTVDGVVAPGGNANDQRLPMPVKWLYVLQDGTLTAPDATSGTTATFANAPTSKRPTNSNPIVGRVAFWTDDETCKVNVNTAAEGNFCDTPRAQGVTDYNNANYPPFQKEYQRYPGHPATTCLSTVLGGLFPVDHTLQANGSGYTSSKPATYAPYDPYFKMAPRLNDTSLSTNLGSQAGTSRTTSGAPPQLTLKSDRLYASVDEFLFQPAAISGGTTRALNPPGATSIDPATLAQAKFFLTASSRAPDVNLFNQPRIVTWPVNVRTNSAYRTVFDQAFAFCGTINGYPYYFQRDRNDHPTNDLPAAATNSGLGRNRVLMQYLQDLTSRTIPGFGGTFSGKYPSSGGVSERDQILTEIFDHIRCLNLVDQSSPTMTHPFAPVAVLSNGYPTKYANTNGAGNTSIYSADAGSGQVVPIYDTVNKTKGFGRFPTISEVAIVFITTGWNDGMGGKATDPNYQGLNGAAPWGYDATLPASTVKVQAALVVNFFDPSQGEVPEYGTYSTQIIGLDSFQWGKDQPSIVPMGFPSTAPANTSNMTTASTSSYPQYASFWGGNLGFRSFFANEFPSKTPGNSQYYPYFSGTQNFLYSPAKPQSPGTFYFSGGTIVVNLLLPTATPGWPQSGWPNPTNGQTPRAPIQSITLTFPPTTLPLPLLPPPGNSSSWGGAKQLCDFGARFRIGSSNQSPNAQFITGSDTVRSVRAYPGDIRLIAGKVSINSSDAINYFDTAQTAIQSSGFTNWTYFDPNQRLVHSLRESCDYPFYGALLGQLVPGITYAGQPSNGAPFTDISSGLNTFSGAGNNSTLTGALMASNLPGDWDNGFGYTADGPYINKPDEGNFSYTAGVPYFQGSNYTYGAAQQTHFSPNRLMPSPVQFGSLPTGVIRNLPWQTLLFCPNPAAIASTSGNHPGFGTGAHFGGNTMAPFVPPFTTPPDHLLLDLFGMPVVEPYPITEPLSTAGKINMNYQIVPFTYMTRDTGFRAVLKAERMTVIPDGASTQYKRGSGTSFPINTTYDFRVPINADETLKGFNNYFATTKDIFRSATQVCDMFLYPARDAALASTSVPAWDASNSAITTFWKTHRLTGDNSRERPYSSIYPRLTTKSNAFTVHMRVQILKKIKNSNPAVWDDTRDQIVSEYRGSQTIERYVDPSDSTLPDFASLSDNNGNGVPDNQEALDAYYKFRVVSTKRFTY